MGKIVKLVVMMLLAGNISVFAQNEEMTSYEKGRVELSAKTMEMIFGYLDQESQAGLLLYMGAAVQNTNIEFDQDVIEDFIIKFCDLEFVYPYKTAIKNKLRPLDMGPVVGDYVLEKWKKVGQWYIIERKKLDATKTQLDKK